MNNNNKKNKKYDDNYIDNLLKKALKIDETADTALTQSVRSRIARPETQTPVSGVAAATPFQKGAYVEFDATYNYKNKSKLPNIKDIGRVLSTVASAVAILMFIVGLGFAAWYLRLVTPPLSANVADIGDSDITENINIVETNIDITDITETYIDITETDISNININITNNNDIDEATGLLTEEAYDEAVFNGGEMWTNTDIIGSIKVENTTIYYPVVQTTDNEYYLVHSFYKQRNPSGAIFVDYTNSINISQNRNLIIFGHNMLDNSMFQPLIIFGANQELFNNGIIEIYSNTDDKIYYYEVFAVYEDNSARDKNSDEDFIYSEFGTDMDFNSDEEYVEFLNEAKTRSIFKKDITLDANSKIITLVTCVNDVTIDRRFIVQGVLIDVK